MTFKSVWHESAVEDLISLDRSAVRKIVGKVIGELTRSPQSAGQPLKGQFKGLFRYRAGEYLVLYAVDYERKEILILAVGHRKKI